MNSNRNSSKGKINLKVNKKAFYINSKFELGNISFKDNWFVPIKIMNALKRRGYSEKMTNSLFIDLKPLIKNTPRSKSKPYDKLDVFYYMDDNILTTKREQFLTALQSFKNKF